MIKHYQLPVRGVKDEAGYVIEETDGDIIWVLWGMYNGIDVKVSAGNTLIEDNVLYLKTWTTPAKLDHEFTDFDKVWAYMDTLPHWDKTRYFTSAGSGGMWPRYCHNSAVLTPEEESAELPDFWKKQKWFQTAADRIRQAIKTIGKE